MKKTYFFGILAFTLITSSSLSLQACSDEHIENEAETSGHDSNHEEDEIKEGLSYSSDQLDADQPITVYFKAEVKSKLYGYKGDVYIHIGVIEEGHWKYVQAQWNENIEKCKMKRIANNTWSITLEPTIRKWFNSGETPVNKLGIVIRNANGSKKGFEQDQFVEVTDNQFTAFVPANIKEQSKPASAIDGINLNEKDNSVTLVLYDKDTEGNHKDYAHVIGDFNNWTLSNDEKSQMYRDNAAGCWWITINELDPTKEYRFQYYIGTKAEGPMRIADPYTEKVLDPHNDKYIPASTYPSAERTYPEQAIGMVATFKIQKEPFGWSVDNFKIKNPKNLIIYEMHLRDFTETGDLNGAIQKLDYLQHLGINTIELMPVQEFDGNDSWGYNPCFFFAMDKAYGTTEMYKRFIDECHQRNIAVLFDVVYNHATGSMPFAQLYWDSSKNQTAPNNPWFNVTAPHPYNVFHDFNHESSLTRNFVKRNLKFLLDEYRIDGFRFDLTKGFTNTTSDESSASKYDQSRVNILTDYYKTIKEKNPHAVMICEHLAGIEEESALSQQGMMLWRNLNDAFCQSAMGYKDNSDFSRLTTWNTPMKEGGWVGYMESHDEERCAYKQTAYSQEPLKTNLNARMNQLGVNAAFFFTVSGPKMIWQFGELGYDVSRDANKEGNIIPGEDHKTDRKPIRWEYKDVKERHQLYTTYSKLIALRNANETLFSQAAFKEWKVTGNDWDNGRYLRLESVDGKKLIVAGNFTNQETTVYNVFSQTGEWYNVMAEGQKESITSKDIKVPAHSFKLYTNFSLK